MEIYNKMDLPAAARIDRVVAKKQFYDNADLSASDQKMFDHVEKVYWRYALKTGNTFIASFSDEEKDYPEIEIMEVMLRDDKQPNRLAELIMHSIPYPILLFFRKGERVRLFLGKLRPNQADTSRMTLTATEQTDWLTEDDAFWKTLSLKKMPTANFCALYEGWFDTVSRSHLTEAGISASELSGEAVRETLEQLKNIEQEMTALRNQMKKEFQFNRKMELNTRLQKLKKEKEKIINGSMG